MITLVRILVAVYLLAINVYGFTLIMTQKRQFEEANKSSVKDGKLLIAGMLGGAIGIYLAMFIFQFRLQSLVLMVIMPILIVMNIYLVAMGFANNFGLLIQSTL